MWEHNITYWKEQWWPYLYAISLPGKKSFVKVINTLQYDISVTPNYTQQGLRRTCNRILREGCWEIARCQFNISHIILQFIEGRNTTVSTYENILLFFCSYFDYADTYIVAYSIILCLEIHYWWVIWKRSNILLKLYVKQLSINAFGFSLMRYADPIGL